MSSDLEYVSDARAGDGLDLSAAHPRPEAELDVLAAPDAHALVERAEPHEVRPVDGDRAADERRRRERQPGLDRCSLLVLLHPDPRVPTTDGTHTHTHTRLTALLSGTTQVSRYQKGKTNLDFTEPREKRVAVASAGLYASLHLAPDR